MMFLRDDDIQLLIAGGHVEGVRFDGDPNGSSSPVQPCSLDLTIGHIYVPGSISNQLGGSEKPRVSHTLGVGETVVVETTEIFHLPSDVGAFGFPPTTISKVGVLVTNLGHIDPGYDGAIKFTLVNMGRKSYSLRASDKIYTTLLFRLAVPAHTDYRTRNPAVPVHIPTQQIDELLDSLPVDFLDVSSRAKGAAKAAVTDELRNPYRGAIISGVVAAIVLVANFWLTIDRTSELRANLEQHKAAIDRQLSIEKTARSSTEGVEENRRALEQLKSEVVRLSAKVDSRRK
jgi:dCTP deaminase